MGFLLLACNQISHNAGSLRYTSGRPVQGCHAWPPLSVAPKLTNCVFLTVCMVITLSCTGAGSACDQVARSGHK